LIGAQRALRCPQTRNTTGVRRAAKLISRTAAVFNAVETGMIVVSDLP